VNDLDRIVELLENMAEVMLLAVVLLGLVFIGVVALLILELT
jgi:hypothetical protein